MNRAAIATLIASAVGVGACRKKDEVAERVAAREAEAVARPAAKPAAPVPTEPAVPPPVASGKDPWLDAERATPATPPEPSPPPVQPADREIFPTDKLTPTSTDGPVDAIVERVRALAKATSPELSVMRASMSYVRKDGSLDPTYGEIEVEFVLLDTPDGVIDDPNRPTGAPVPETTKVEATRSQCPTVKLRKGGWPAWSATESLCDKTKLISGPRCSVASIWARAIVQGAPDNAVAIVQYNARRGTWSFRITDKVRSVDFNRSYRDDCPPGGAGSAAPIKPSAQIKRTPYAEDRK